MALEFFLPNVPSIALCSSRTLPSLQLLLTLFHLLSIQIPLASPLSFNFSGDELKSSMSYQGDAFFDGSTVQLTKNELYTNLSGSTGRMVYSYPVTIYDEISVANFTSCFSFLIFGFNHEWAGDGLAFFLSSYPSSIPDFSGGGALAMFTSPDGNITYPSTVVAVEFDTFLNPQFNDISHNHMGIDVHTIYSVVQLDLKTSMKNNNTFNACVNYKAAAQNLSVFLSNASDPTQNWSLSFVIDLRKVLPANVTVGFAAATGVMTESHRLLSWSFSPSDFGSQAPSPRSGHGYIILGICVGAGVLLCGLGLLWFLRRCLCKKGDGGKTELVDTTIDSLID